MAPRDYKIKSYFTALSEATNDNTNPMKLVVEKINQKNVIIWIAELGQVFFPTFFLSVFFLFLSAHIDHLHCLNCTFRHAIFQQHCFIFWHDTRFLIKCLMCLSRLALSFRDNLAKWLFFQCACPAVFHALDTN